MADGWGRVWMMEAWSECWLGSSSPPSLRRMRGLVGLRPCSSPPVSSGDLLPSRLTTSPVSRGESGNGHMSTSPSPSCAAAPGATTTDNTTSSLDHHVYVALALETWKKNLMCSFFPCACWGAGVFSGLPFPDHRSQPSHGSLKESKNSRVKWKVNLASIA